MYKKYEVVCEGHREFHFAKSLEELLASMVDQLRAEIVGTHAVEFPDGSRAVVFEADR